MINDFEVLKEELELTKEEIDKRLSHINDDLFLNHLSEKEKVLLQSLKAEQHDVNRALQKMDYGLYGFCEMTGERIPFEQLKILPTARYVDETSIVGTFV